MEEPDTIQIDTENQKSILINTAEFAIDEDNVDGELCQSGAKLCFYGNLAADLEAEAATKKADLEYTYSLLAIQIRKDYTGTTRLTEGGLKEQITIDGRYINKKNELIETEKNYAKANNFWRAQQKRADCIIALAYKQRTEIAKY